MSHTGPYLVLHAIGSILSRSVWKLHCSNVLHKKCVSYFLFCSDGAPPTRRLSMSWRHLKEYTHVFRIVYTRQRFLRQRKQKYQIWLTQAKCVYEMHAAATPQIVASFQLQQDGLWWDLCVWLLAHVGAHDVVIRRAGGWSMCWEEFAREAASPNGSHQGPCIKLILRLVGNGHILPSVAVCIRKFVTSSIKAEATHTNGAKGHLRHRDSMESHTWDSLKSNSSPKLDCSLPLRYRFSKIMCEYTYTQLYTDTQTHKYTATRAASTKMCYT